MPEESDLLDIARNTPCAGGPGGGKYDIPWAEPTFFAFLIGNEGFARNKDKSLVLVVCQLKWPVVQPRP